MAAFSLSVWRLRDDNLGRQRVGAVRTKTGWVIGLFAALAIGLLVVGSLGYSLVFQEEAAPPRTNWAAGPTAPSTAAAPPAPAATPAPASSAPTTAAPSMAAAP